MTDSEWKNRRSHKFSDFDPQRPSTNDGSLPSTYDGLSLPSSPHGILQSTHGHSPPTHEDFLTSTHDDHLPSTHAGHGDLFRELNPFSPLPPIASSHDYTASEGGKEVHENNERTRSGFCEVISSSGIRDGNWSELDRRDKRPEFAVYTVIPSIETRTESPILTTRTECDSKVDCITTVDEFMQKTVTDNSEYKVNNVNSDPTGSTEDTHSDLSGSAEDTHSGETNRVSDEEKMDSDEVKEIHGEQFSRSEQKISGLTKTSRVYFSPDIQ